MKTVEDIIHETECFTFDVNDEEQMMIKEIFEDDEKETKLTNSKLISSIRYFMRKKIDYRKFDDKKYQTSVLEGLDHIFEKNNIQPKYKITKSTENDGSVSMDFHFCVSNLEVYRFNVKITSEKVIKDV